MSIFWNGAEVNTLMWNGVETTGVYNGNIVWGNSTQQAKTLTLYHSEGGSLTADTLTGYPGDSVNLTTAYNTYWRFSGYDVTGDGTLNGNTYTFGNTDTTICACYKVNAFTASGGWEKGSDVSVSRWQSTGDAANVPAKYAIQSYHTSNVPASWYSNSNRWSPSNASAYSITLNPITRTDVSVGANKSYYAKGASSYYCLYIGNNATNGQNFSRTSTGSQTFIYSKSVTNSTQTTYYIAGWVNAKGNGNKYYPANGTSKYVAAGTTGTWVATGYAP
jgi:hypothetical protein